MEFIAGILDVYSSDEIGYYLMMYAAIGVGGALVGFVIGTGSRLLIDQLIH
jgi:hypothetical protein